MATATHSHVFYNSAGYVEMTFIGIIYASDLQRLMTEARLLASKHGPIGLLVDGRNGRLQHDAGTLLALSEIAPIQKLTHMIVLTSNSSWGQTIIVKDPKGLVTAISALTFNIPLRYVSDETVARQWAAGRADELL